MRADRGFYSAQSLVNCADFVTIELSVTTFALKHEKLAWIGIECKAVEMGLASCDWDLFLHGLPMRQLIDCINERALNQ